MVTLLEHESGRTETYLIDGAHGSLDSNVVSAVSPMGSALIGSARGAVVRVDLPRKRVRTLTVLDVALSERRAHVRRFSPDRDGQGPDRRAEPRERAV